jgi:hypothetical protein
VASALMLGWEMWKNPVPTLWGLAVISAGVPLYVLFTRRSRRRS